MNALAAVRSRAEPAGHSALGVAAEVLAIWRVQPGAMMVLGRTRGGVPSSGVAQVQRMPGVRGVFRCLSWTVGENGVLLFIAAVRLADRVELQGGALIGLRGTDGEMLTLSVPEGPAEDAEFGRMAAGLSGSCGAAVAGFLLDTLRRPAASRNEPDLPSIAAMLRSFLSQAATDDGCIEIMAMVPDACVFLQGWGAPVHGAVQVILAGAAVTCFAGQAGGFARSDTAAPATGVMLAVPPQALGALSRLEQVFILDEHGLHARTLVEYRLLDTAASIGHARHMLPQLRGPAPLLALFQEAARPRYDGRDTLSSGPHPVRAAVDVAAGSDAGVYLSGWVFDPRRIIAALHLCNAAELVARLDTAWNRIPRPDVSEAFRDEPGFPAPPDPDAGFAVFVPQPVGENRALHLQFDFADGDRAFFPIRADDPGSAAFRARLLASVDLYKPSGLPIVERHVAPFLARVRAGHDTPARVLVAGPVDRPDVIVIPLAAQTLPRAFLSGFLHDAAGPDEQLVLVCGPEWDQASLDALRELVRFHALPATILASVQTACALVAIQEAAAVTAGRSFLLVGLGVCGRAPGWRQALRRAAAASPNAAFVCPTLLYEDWSIRFAGATLLAFQDTAPFIQAHAALAGMPASGVHEGGERPAQSGSLECCLLLPAALAVLAGTGALATEGGREIGFFLRLRAAGLGGAWAPGVQVYAPENPTVEGVGSRVGRLVDGWILREAGMALDARSAA